MSMFRTSLTVGMTALLIGTPVALAQTTDHMAQNTMMMGQGHTQAPNAEFAMKANISGSFEILSSQLALAKSKDPAVRAYAEKMIADHSKASAGLNEAVRAEGLTVHPALLDQKHRDLFDRLKTTSDDDFDDAYVDIQTSAHDEAVSLFRNYAEDGPQGPLKDFAVKTLPALEAHHSQIKALDERN